MLNKPKETVAKSPMTRIEESDESEEAISDPASSSDTGVNETVAERLAEKSR